MPRSLATYKAKRDFAKTAEPADGAPTPGGDIFMVQKHDATRLHWDFRLELDGVLLSWAVTRGPSDDPEDKRLAVRTEDHPLGYATFEGTIPEGQYGGGTVMLWDRGTWTPMHDPKSGLKSGKLHFVLHGERMKGEWILIRLRAEGKRENWLLRKVEDEWAGKLDMTDTHMTSVASGRTMEEIAEGGGAVWNSDETRGKNPLPLRERARDAPLGAARGEGLSKSRTAAQPLSRLAASAASPPSPARGEGSQFRAPMLATLVDTPPTGNDWLHETKYDGYRALIAVAGGKATAYTRSGLDWTEKFAGVAAAAAKLKVKSAVLDGEIIALDAEGKPSFGALQANLKDGGALLYFAFDLLELNGEDLAKQPLEDRKAALAKLLTGIKPPLHYAEHVRGGGEAMFSALCGAGYEGLVSKKAGSKYSGGRSPVWLKSKCTKRQEFVIGGWSESDKRRGFASLLLGVQDKDGLRYAGRVGTGFDDRTMADLTEQFAKLATDASPFAAKLTGPERRGAHFVLPRLVCEVAFTEWTADHHLRHPSFLGLRADKAAGEVVEETPISVRAASSSLPPRAAESEEGRGGGRRLKLETETPHPNPPHSRARRAPGGEGAEAQDTFFGVHITSADREVFPEVGLTKGALAAYYAAVAGPMLKLMRDRPVSLVRCPQGRGKQCFFQKHDSGMFGGKLPSVDIVESDGKTEPYLYVHDEAGLITAVQMGTIEFHGWGSTVADLERPDRLVIDLDPDEGLDWAAIQAAALVVRDRLSEAGLESMPLLSGGKGVHIVVPLKPKAEWPEVKAWAKAFAEGLESDIPQAFVANMSKAKRKGRIFVDWLRNQRGATAVMPFSVRARPNAPVAVPVSWEQLAKAASPAMFTAADPAAVLRQAAVKLPVVKPKVLPSL